MEVSSRSGVVRAVFAPGRAALPLSSALAAYSPALSPAQAEAVAVAARARSGVNDPVVVFSGEEVTRVRSSMAAGSLLLSSALPRPPLVARSPAGRVVSVSVVPGPDGSQVVMVVSRVSGVSANGRPVRLSAMRFVLDPAGLVSEYAMSLDGRRFVSVSVSTVVPVVEFPAGVPASDLPWPR